MRSTTPAAAPLLLLLAVSCSEGGGSSSTPGTTVPLTDTHHLFLLSTPPRFGGFPVPSRQVVPLWGSVTFRADSSYTIMLNNSAGGDRYDLDADGQLDVFVTPSNRARIRYVGGYGLEGDTGLFHFTDRFATSSGDEITLFFGAKVAPGGATPTLESDWHVLTQHLILTTSTILDPDNLARSMGGGAITIDSAGAITTREAGVESTGAPITYGGTATAFSDGSVNLDLTWIDAQGGMDTRSFLCAAGLDVIVGLDNDAGDGEVGLVGLVEVRSGPVDPAMLEGTYLLGMHTVFMDVSRPGSDVAAGRLTFNATNGFTLDATGADGRPFSYTGTYALDPDVDGGLILTVPSTNETWNAAVDEGYHTVVLVDAVVELRSGTKPPELNWVLAHREEQAP